MIAQWIQLRPVVPDSLKKSFRLSLLLRSGKLISCHRKHRRISWITASLHRVKPGAGFWSDSSVEHRMFIVRRCLYLQSRFYGQGWNNLSVDVWKFSSATEWIIKYRLFQLTEKRIFSAILYHGSLAQPWDVICCQCSCAYILLSILISHAKPLKCHTFFIVLSRFSFAPFLVHVLF